jgi:NADH:ubiquinone oxidoreductase subunit 6 (subunit J)
LQEQQVVHHVPPRELWFGVAAGPILWILHLVASYVLVALHCQWQFFSFTLFGISGIVAILVIMTLVVVAVVLYAGYLALADWRQIRATGAGGGRVAERHRFMAYSGVLLSALFFLVIIISLVPSFVLATCALP